MDKHKDIEIRLGQTRSVQWLQEVISVSGNNSELLNAVYKELAEKLGMDIAMNIYQMFKGQQINFPVRFFNTNKIQELIVQEYDGTNVKTLATKYNYSEKTIRRIIRESVENNT